MNKRTISIISMIMAMLMFVSSFAGCSAKPEQSESQTETVRINSVEDLSGRKVATLRGTIMEGFISQAIPSCEIVLYDTVQELSENLSKGNIDAFIAEEANNVIQNYPDLCIIGELGESNIASIFPKTDEGQKLCNEFNTFLSEINSDISLEELQRFWNDNGNTEKNIDLDSLTGENGNIELAVCTDVGAPLSYQIEGEYLGYETDLVYRFCKQYGYKLNITNYDFSSLLEAVKTGKAQMGASSITVTEQRKESLIFSDVTYSSSFQLVVRAADTDITSVEYLSGDDSDISKIYAEKKIGVEAGTVHSVTISTFMPESEICFFNSVDDFSAALDNREIDAYVTDEPTARINITENDGYYIAGTLEKCNYAYAFPKNNEKSDILISQMNDFLAELKKSGDLEKIDSIWFGNDENKKVVNYSNLTGDNGVLTFAISSENAGVFAYEKNGEYVGYDVDIAVRFCDKYGYGINIVDTNFSAVIASVIGGRCDFAGSLITITEDRKKNMEFSDPNYYGNVVLVSKEYSDSDIPVLSDNSLLSALDGCKLGILTGTIYDQIAEELTPNSTLMMFNSISDLFIALDSGIIDGYYADMPQGRIGKKYYPDQYIYAVISLSNNGMIFPKDNIKSDTIRSQVNQYIADIKADGTFKEINELWFGNDEEKQVVDYDSLTGENGIINIASSTMVGEPFCYIKDGQMVGYDLDMICRFCKEYGYGMNVVDYDFAGMLAAVSTGKADIGAACITITEERKEIMNFSEPNYYSGGIIVTKDSVFAPQSEDKSAFESFTGDISESFNKTFLKEDRWKLFVDGIYTTVLISLFSILFGTALGFIIYLGYRQNTRFFNSAVDFTCDMLNKTPTVLILMILFYIVFVDSKLGGFWVSVICFSILFACTVTQLFKVSVQAVNSGQREASLALGYTEMQSFIYVILPQALKQFIPVYKAEIVALIKSTAIVGYIAVQDLTKVSDIIRARTFEPFFALIVSTIIYIAISSLLIALVERTQLITDPRKRSKEKILKGVKIK